MTRRILAAVLALVVFNLVVSGVEAVSHRIYKMPEGLDKNDMAALGAWIATLPVPAFLMVLGGWTVGGFAGGFVGRKVGKHRGPALVVAGFGTLAIVMVNQMIPGPVWMWSGLLLLGPAALLGDKLAAGAESAAGAAQG